VYWTLAAYPQCSADMTGVRRTKVRRGAWAPVLAVGIHCVAAEAGNGSFGDVAGQYVAGSADLQCRLKIWRSGRYSFSCGGDPAHTGTAVLGDGHRITIRVPVYGPPGTAETLVPRVPSGPDKPSWPPSLQDPTPPLVGPEHMRLESMTLIPLRWGSRRYLVRQGAVAEFCNSIAQGTEPRSVAAGWDFLRAGDHRKKAGKTGPTECGIGARQK
jgi:hypothetical protein